MQVPTGPFWFFPMIFCLYLGIPLLSKMLLFLSDVKRRAYCYSLATCLFLASTAIPTLSDFRMLSTHHVNSHSVIQMNIFGADSPYSSVWGMYLIVGYLLKRYEKIIEKRLTIPSCLTVFFLSFISLWVFHICMRMIGLDDTFFYSNILVVGSAVSLFIFLKRCCHFSGKVAKHFTGSITKIARLSFGVYMIHNWIFTFIFPVVKSSFVGSTRSYLLFFILLIICYIGSLLISFIFSYVFFIRKWLLLMK